LGLFIWREQACKSKQLTICETSNAMSAICETTVYDSLKGKASLFQQMLKAPMPACAKRKAKKLF